MIKDDGTGAEQVTFNDVSSTASRCSSPTEALVFASNRNGKEKGETNLFLADWVD